jgi:hypothetical protein
MNLDSITESFKVSSIVYVRRALELDLISKGKTLIIIKNYAKRLQ